MRTTWEVPQNDPRSKD